MLVFFLVLVIHQVLRDIDYMTLYRSLCFISRHVVFHEDTSPFHSLTSSLEHIDHFPSIVLPTVLHDTNVDVNGDSQLSVPANLPSPPIVERQVRVLVLSIWLTRYLSLEHLLNQWWIPLFLHIQPLPKLLPEVQQDRANLLPIFNNTIVILFMVKTLPCLIYITLLIPSINLSLIPLSLLRMVISSCKCPLILSLSFIIELLNGITSEKLCALN